MTAYYPSQVGYATSQPVALAHSGYGVPGSYVPGGVAVPAMMSATPTVAGPVMMQPAYGGYGGGGGYYSPYSWGNRIRRFFGLAVDPGVRYKSNRATWGFMGYSRRQRYIDARTGGEVDRRGRPVFRV